jgi:protease-4
MAKDDIQVTSVNPPGDPASQQIIIQQAPRSGRFGKWIVIGLVGTVIVVMAMVSGYRSYYVPRDMPEEKYHSLDKYAGNKIAVIEVTGPIYDEADGYVKKQIDLVREDPSVVGVVVRIDSPGGTVTGSDYVYHHLREMVEKRKIPLVVSMGSVCASGGYYVAMAVGNQPKTIFAEPTTWTGSIGVVIPHYDFSELLNKWNIADDSIASHPLKLMGSPTRQPPEEYAAKEREILEQLVKESFEDFKTIVKSGRPALAADAKKLETVTTGQIFTAKQAQRLGLVDKLGFVEDAIDRAVELAALDKDSVRVVKYTRPKGLFEEALGLPTGQSASMDLNTLLDLTAPRAYYLCTWLPGFAAVQDRR